MLDSIFVGMTGLAGCQQGLRVIAHNTANVNTPGFKGSALPFADVVRAGAFDDGAFALGAGVQTHEARTNFRQGDLRQTGQDLDLAIDGEGMFMLRDEAGRLRYTRAGQFEFDEAGVLAKRGGGAAVLGVDASGALAPITLAGLRTHPARATRTVTFAGNLSSTASEQVVGGVTVLDGAGGAHELSVTFTSEADTAPGRWRVTVKDGSTEVGTGALAFVDGRPAEGESAVAVTYRPAGRGDLPLQLEFGRDVTSFESGDLSTLAMSTHDGLAAGSLAKASFDADGVLTAAYSNGQTAQGLRLALGRFDSLAAVEADGDNAFRAVDERAWRRGVASEGGFGAVRAGAIEASNVDLSQEFSDLVILQRGYQASSQVITTANDLLQQLFAMKAR